MTDVVPSQAPNAGAITEPTGAGNTAAPTPAAVSTAVNAAPNTTQIQEIRAQTQAPQQVVSEQNQAVASAPTAAAVDPYDSLYTPEQGDQSQPTQVPESYDFAGVNVKNTAFLEHDQLLVSTLGKEIGLTNEQARKLLEKGEDAFAQNLKAKVMQNTQTWLAEVNSDPVLGGANLPVTKANLHRVMQRYGQEAAAVLKESGIGSHPAIVRMLNAIGRDLGQETKFVTGTVQEAPKRDPLRSVYKNSPELRFGD